MSKKKAKTIEKMEDGKIITESLPISKESKEKRSRKFCITTYIDINAIISFLRSAPWVQHWALCTHDRDVNVDGSAKPIHTHILLYTFDAKSSSGVRKIFDRYSQEVYKNLEQDAQNTLVQPCFDMVSQYRYLIHKDDIDKAQYEEIERMTDNYAYWHKLELTQGLNCSSKNYALAIVDDILADVSERDLVTRYGREWVINRNKYIAVARAVERERYIKPNDATNMVNIMLNQSELPKQLIDNFYIVLNFLQQEAHLSYNQSLDFVIAEKNQYQLYLQNKENN